MNLRLVKIFLPLSEKAEADKLLRKSNADEFWHDRISDKKVLIRVLILAEEMEEFIDEMEKEFSHLEDFRLIILPVEASLPRLQEDEEEDQKKDTTKERIGREELYTNILSNAQFSWTYLTLIILASIVGAIGLSKGNIPMIVGAMIIAPFLGPAVGLSLGTVLADYDLTVKSLKTLTIGILSSLLFSVIVGVIFSIDPATPEIALRTQVELGDAIVSLVSGSVGVLSFTTGTLTSLAGVMVAVSLLPPLVAGGMLLGAGLFSEMSMALLLFLVNLICINLSGVITFLLQKISPRSQWKTLKAQLFTGLSILFWVILLILISVFLI